MITKDNNDKNNINIGNNNSNNKIEQTFKLSRWAFYGLVVFSFCASFLGASIFFLDVPHDVPIKVDSLLPKDSYYIKSELLIKLLSADVPKEFVDQLRANLQINFEKQKFTREVMRLLDKNENILASNWVLTRPFYNLFKEISSHSGQIDNNLIVQGMAQYNQSLDTFCREFDLSAHFCGNASEFSYLVDPIKDLESIDEIKKSLTEVGYAQARKILFFVLTENGRHSPGWEIWVTFCYKIIFAFFFALISSLMIAVPLRRMADSRYRTLGTQLRYYPITALGFILSGVSSYVLIWIITNHSTYVDELQKQYHAQVLKWIPKTENIHQEVDKLIVSISEIEDFYRSLEDNHPAKLRQHFQWLIQTNTHYEEMINAFDSIQVAKEDVAEIESQKKHFELENEEGLSKKHVQHIKAVQNAFSGLEGEIKGGKSRQKYNKEGYGPKAQKRAIYLGTTLYAHANELCELIVIFLPKKVDSFKKHMQEKLVDRSLGQAHQPAVACPFDEQWKKDWETPNSKKYQRKYGRNTNARNFINEFGEKFSFLKTTINSNLDAWESIFNGLKNYIDSRENINKDSLLTFKESYGTKVKTIIESANEGSSKLFEKQQEMYHYIKEKLPDFKILEPQKEEVHKPLHEVIRNYLLVVIFNTYHIPPKNYDVLAQRLQQHAKNIQEEKMSTLKNLEEKIFFSKQRLISEIENQFGLRISEKVFSGVIAVRDYDSQIVLYPLWWSVLPDLFTFITAFLMRQPSDKKPFIIVSFFFKDKKTSFSD